MSSSNITYSDSGITSEYIDLLANAVHVVDVDLGDTLITDTTQPAAPQVTHTVLQSEMPINKYVIDYCIYATIGGKNNDVASRNVNAAILVNGVQYLTGNSGGTPAGQFWYYLARVATIAIHAGDVIGFEMWAAAAGVVDYRYMSIYVIPRTIDFRTQGQAYMAFVLPPASSVVVTGAVAGVTYALTATASDQHSLFDPSVPATSSNPPAGRGKSVLPQSWVFTTNLNSNFANVAGVQSLGSVGIKLYWRKYIFH